MKDTKTILQQMQETFKLKSNYHSTTFLAVANNWIFPISQAYIRESSDKLKESNVWLKNEQQLIKK